MTAGAVALSASSTTIDLRSAATSTFGTQARKTVGSVQALWAGDVRFNADIKLHGLGQRPGSVLQRIGGVVPTNVVSGYHPEDVDLDREREVHGLGQRPDASCRTSVAWCPRPRVRSSCPERTYLRVHERMEPIQSGHCRSPPPPPIACGGGTDDGPAREPASPAAERVVDLSPWDVPLEVNAPGTLADSLQVEWNEEFGQWRCAAASTSRWSWWKPGRHRPVEGRPGTGPAPDP